MTTEESKTIDPGYKTSEFWLQIPLYILAAYVLYEGISPEQVKDVFTEIEGQVTSYKEMFNTLFGLAAPTIGTMFYVQKRTELKK